MAGDDGDVKGIVSTPFDSNTTRLECERIWREGHCLHSAHRVAWSYSSNGNGKLHPGKGTRYPFKRVPNRGKPANRGLTDKGHEYLRTRLAQHQAFLARRPSPSRMD